MEGVMGEGFEKAMLFLIILGMALAAFVAIGIEQGAVWIYHHVRVLWN
jgi:hypothetical protein